MMVVYYHNPYKWFQMGAYYPKNVCPLLCLIAGTVRYSTGEPSRDLLSSGNMDKNAADP